jgi:hypothetical protein
MREPDPLAARISFRKSLDLSRHQGAREWELRTASDLAKLLEEHGDPKAHGRYRGLQFLARMSPRYHLVAFIRGSAKSWSFIAKGALKER